jgi:phage terminase large subunit-like protein
MPSCELTPRQLEANALLAGPQRHTLLVGGARSGKTFLLIRAMLLRALRVPDSRHAIVRYRWNAVRQSIWLDTLPKVARLCWPKLTLTDHRQDSYVSLPNGSELWFAGLDEPQRMDKILGQEFATVYFNECSQIPYSSVLVMLTRLAQRTELQNRAYYDLNPTGLRHWTKLQFIDGLDPISRASLENPADYASMRMNPIDNLANLDPAYMATLERFPARQRRRFLDGEYQAEVDGALWPVGLIDQHRRTAADVPDLVRVVVGVDPSGASGVEDDTANEIGIIAAGRGADGHAYVLEDGSGTMSPRSWARTVVDLYRRRLADRIVAERNFGGDMVATVISTADPHAPVELVTASRGKVVRAEPIAALYEQGLVHHVGHLPELEDQMEAFSTSGYTGSGSPDRADGAVWALTELMLTGAPAMSATPSMKPDPAIEPREWC